MIYSTYTRYTKVWLTSAQLLPTWQMYATNILADCHTSNSTKGTAGADHNDNPHTGTKDKSRETDYLTSYTRRLKLELRFKYTNSINS